MHVGVDTGGTFTDVVVASVQRRARSSRCRRRRDDPSDAVRSAVGASAGRHPRRTVLAHGTTVATNALLQHRLARIALVATRGFADVDRDRAPGAPVALRPARRPSPGAGAA